MTNYKINKIQTLNLKAANYLIMYLVVADLKQSQKPNMGKWHLLHNPTEHKSDEFLCKNQSEYKNCNFISHHLLTAQ